MKIYIGKSKLHGKGLFASKDIKKGETIFIIKGHRVSFLINDKKQAQIAGLNWVGVGKNEWVDPIKHCVYFNHSCEPNSAIKGKVTVVALKDIKKDEEVLFDYSFNEADIFWHIKCNCGSKNCRKIIKSIQFLPHKHFTKHISKVPKYYRQIFKKFNVSNFKNADDLKTNWVDFIKKDSSV
ncbi:MAG: SET domain-containing protein-lysine N-methyltransferase [Candidatus Nomurabacteria bacterium]|nr:SET domain-containing protein-lysine N-methyltransferase [Candidatus Nomurabacteria bacterium]